MGKLIIFGIKRKKIIATNGELCNLKDTIIKHAENRNIKDDF